MTDANEYETVPIPATNTASSAGQPSTSISLLPLIVSGQISDLMESERLRHSAPTNLPAPGMENLLQVLRPHDLWEVLMTSSIQIKTILLIAYRLPKCSTSLCLREMLCEAIGSDPYEVDECGKLVHFSNLNSATPFGDNKPKGLSNAKLSVIIQSNNPQKPVYRETKTPYLDVIESAVKSCYMEHSQLICSYSEQKIEDTEVFCRDQMLSNHLVTAFQWMKNKHEFHHKSNPTCNIHSDETLMNVWDIGGNRSVFHFLPALWGKLHHSFMWLFFDGDYDANKLHERYDDSGHVMPYRTRLRYLLREAKLARSGTHGQPNCSIIGVSRGGMEEKTMQFLEAIISNGAIATGVCGVQLEFCLYSTLKDLMKEKMDHMLKSQIKMRKVPLKYIFLRSAYYSHLDVMFVSKQTLQEQAEKLKIPKNEFKPFCKLFSSSGSIIDIDDLGFIIMKPMEFIRKLDDLFRHDCNDDNCKLTTHGLLTIDGAKKIFGDEFEYFLEVLVAVKLALHLDRYMLYDKTTQEAALCTEGAYYIPDVRSTERDLGNIEDAFLLRMNINCSLSHMQVLLAKEILSLDNNFTLYLEENCAVNLTKFQTGVAVDDTTILTLQYLGEVVEFSVSNGPVSKNVANIVVSACNKVMEQDKFETKYNFAIKCGSHNIADRLVHPSHTVPYESLKCQAVSSHAADHWNEALRGRSIDEIIPKAKQLLEWDITYKDMADITHCFSDLSRKTLAFLSKQFRDDVSKQLHRAPLSPRPQSAPTESEIFRKLFERSPGSNFEALSSLIYWQAELSNALGREAASTTALAEFLMKVSDQKEFEEDKLKLQSLASKLDFSVFHKCAREGQVKVEVK